MINQINTNIIMTILISIMIILIRIVTIIISILVILIRMIIIIIKIMVIRIIMASILIRMMIILSLSWVEGRNLHCFCRCQLATSGFTMFDDCHHHNDDDLNHHYLKMIILIILTTKTIIMHHLQCFLVALANSQHMAWQSNVWLRSWWQVFRCIYFYLL